MTTSQPPLTAPRRILLIQLRRLGDVLLSTPLLSDLREAFPDARIDFLVGRAAAPLLEGEPLAGELLVYDSARPVREIRRLRARRYDWVIDIQSNPRTAQLALLSGARVRAGWAIRGIWRHVYTHGLPRGGRAPEYVPRERQRMLEMLGVPVAPRRPHLHPTGDEREQGERLLQALDIGGDDRVVGFTLGAGEPTKQWPPAHWAELSRRLRAQETVPLLFEMPGDEGRVAAFRDAGGDAIVARLPELRRFLGALPRCDVFVASDTGPAHMATALDVPTVTLHGPTNPANWSASLPTTIPVRRNTGCPVCARGLGAGRAGHDCMERLDVDVVEDAVASLLSAPRESASRGAGEAKA